MTADKAYDSKENHEHLSKNHIRNGIITRKNHTKLYIREHIERVSNIAKKIRPLIEHKFAELKKHHGLGLARYWGLIKMPESISDLRQRETYDKTDLLQRFAAKNKVTACIRLTKNEENEQKRQNTQDASATPEDSRP